MGSASGFLHIVDACGARVPCCNRRLQSGERWSRVPMASTFTLLSGIIAHPAGNAQDVGLAFHEPAKADALHSTANQKAAG